MDTLRELQKQNACKAGIIWIKGQKDKSLKSLFVQALKEKKYQDLNWAISRLLKKDDKTRYAIYAAKQVLSIFEKEYPKDERPRLAIEAAENYLKNPTQENKDAAYAEADAVGAAYAADAAYAAAYGAVYAAYAADAAAYAAYAAYAAAYAEADAAQVAADAAYAAVDAAAYAEADAVDAAHAAVKEKMYTEILKYGYKLLEKDKKL